MSRKWIVTSLTFIICLLSFSNAAAQVTGTVVDAADGAPVPYASVVYKGRDVAAKCDANGNFRIERHNGWRLTFSSVGYLPQVVNIGPSTPAKLTVRLKTEDKKLEGVTVQSKRKTRYSRKNNPAVDLMRRVIANKKKSDIHQHDFFRYVNYQKLSVSLNALTEEDLQSGLFKRFPWLNEEHVEVSQYNDKKVMPLNINETVSERIYRKSPRKEKTIILGRQATGLNDLIQSGEFVNVIIKDIFNDIDIYDDNILLLRHKFCSPIGRDAIAFYRYYITDTVFVGDDRCIQLDFVANNQQDYSFRGQLFVVDDSTCQVKRCEMVFPRSNDVNWVDGLQCMQEFTRQDNGEWLLTVDDMIAELKVADFMAKLLVTRTTRYRDFDFSPIDRKRFRGGDEEIQAGASSRDSVFWAQHRDVEFSKGEKSLGKFLRHIQSLKGYKYVIFVMKAFFENYIETGTKEHPSKFDIGPLMAMFSQNFYDGFRLRLGGQTTASLSPHFFWRGYVARGFDSKENYFDMNFTYSLNRKEFLPQEFPQRNLTFSAKRDVSLPSDKYVVNDKDNVFASFKVHEIDKMLLYNNQQVAFDYETDNHLRLSARLKTEKITPIGNLAFQRVSDGYCFPSIRYTEGTLGVRLSPKERFFNTKMNRFKLNDDAWFVSLQHTMGFNRFLGGDYKYNFTEVELYRRNWLPMSWGHIDTRLRAGAQWNVVPYPLLIMPSANLSYINNYETFAMINNMEFLNDRYVSLMLNWEMGGKLLNRIPLLRKLKWREVFEVKALWGKLTDKNNPTLPGNVNSNVLMHFPEGSYVMDGKKPYVEWAVGIQNIFNMFQIEYVHRVNYHNLPTAAEHGVRVAILPTF